MLKRPIGLGFIISRLARWVGVSGPRASLCRESAWVELNYRAQLIRC
jgi:hypothetical protein